MEDALELTLPSGPTAASAARSALTRSFSASLTVRTLDDVRLLATELISNSQRHSAMRDDDRVSLRAQLEDGLMRVEVRDPGRGGPVRMREPNGQEGGYGLVLVQRLAKRWGVERSNETVVWFELPARSGR
jgi:anti-sigma regulatory factor (Ser/Thr protein kinase)